VTASLAAPWPGTEPARRAAPAPQGAAEAAPDDAEPVRDAPPTKGEPQAGAGQSPAAERTAAPPPPEPSAPAEAANRSRPLDDPFSVEEIEAEFARLLGRPSGGDRT
jgi:hypothetical protein